MKTCTQCRGYGKTICPVCRGSKSDPRNLEVVCGQCNGTGYVECLACLGSGKLDDDQEDVKYNY